MHQIAMPAASTGQHHKITSQVGLTAQAGSHVDHNGSIVAELTTKGSIVTPNILARVVLAAGVVVQKPRKHKRYKQGKKKC